MFSLACSLPLTPLLPRPLPTADRQAPGHLPLHAAGQPDGGPRWPAAQHGHGPARAAGRRMVRTEGGQEGGREGGGNAQLSQRDSQVRGEWGVQGLPSSCNLAVHDGVG